MTKVDVTLIGLAALWIGFVGLAWIVLRELGWARLKHRLGGLFLVAMSIAALPGGVALKVAWPHRQRILALFISHESPAIVFQNGCSMFPANNVWNSRVFSLPLDSSSGRWLANMNPERGVHLDATMPYAVFYNDEPVTQVDAEAASESEPGPYRIPDDAPVEPSSDGHLIALDANHCVLYELFQGRRIGPHRWQAGSAAIYDLKANTLRPDGWTSADGAGLPILPGLLRYDEVKAGRIAHALRFTTPRTQRKTIWPARHFASQYTTNDFPPMGARFRLRNNYDISGFSRDAQVILAALKEYGMIVSDNGGSWFITSSSDTRWKRSLFHEMEKVQGVDFEAVDIAALMIDKDSGAAKQ